MEKNSVDPNRLVFARPDMRSLALFQATGGAYVNTYNQLRLALAHDLAKDMHVLDLGCGIGSFSIPLSKVARSLVAVDFSAAMLAELKQAVELEGLTNLQIVEADLCKLPAIIPANSFDLVISFSTLYYVKDIASALHEMSIRLKPGGKALIELGNAMSLNSLAMQAVINGPEFALLSQKEMFRLIEDSGFKRIGQRRFQLLPMWGRYCSTGVLGLLLPTGSSGLARYCFSRHINNRMLDEWLCALPVMNKFAFRHLFLLEKQNKTLP